MNFGMVVPKYVNKGEPYQFYTGLAIVSACMKQHNYNVFCLNPNHYDGTITQQLMNFITNNKIDVICTGGMSGNYNEIRDVLKISKKFKSDIITIVGGTIITSNPNITLSNMKYIDYGVIGEAEETIIELANTIINKQDVSSIKGIAYFVSETKYIITPDRIPISNLDTIPFPDYEGFEYDKYMKLFYSNDNVFFSVIDEERRFGNIMSSRSCPFACTFCYHHHLSKYRQRSLDNVFQEIDYLVNKYNINILGIADDLFSYNKKRMYEFASRIKKYNIKWYTSLRVSDVDKEVLKTLKDSGLFGVGYGIESINDNILKSMKKHITKTQIEKALKLTYEAKISMLGNIILGDPEETEETVKKSIDWLIAHPEYSIHLVMIKTYPQAHIYKYALSKGLIKDEFKYMVDGFPLVNLTKMSDKKYKEISIYAENFLEEKQHLLNGEIIKSDITSKTENGKNIFTVNIKCPRCNTISEYKNRIQSSFLPNCAVICKNCYVRVSVENIKLYSHNYSFYDKIISFFVKYARQRVNKNKCIRFAYYIIQTLKKHKIISISNKYV